MTLYIYTALNPNGATVKGEIEAPSETEAMERLAGRGHIPEKIREKSQAQAVSTLETFANSLTPVKTRDIILFTKQLKTLLQAGVAILQILNIMEIQTENKRLKKIIHTMADDIREGASLTQAFGKHQKVFSKLYCAMIQAGEASGSLPEVLDRLIYIIDHEHKVKSDIKGAMRYPAIVTAFLGIAFFVLLTFVIPKFISIFDQAHIELPLPTKICMNLYQIIDQYWPILLCSLALITVLGYKTFFKTERGQYIRDRLFLSLPLIGHLITKAAMSRFASIFAILQSSGVTVLESMDILAETIANAAITKEFSKVKNLLTEGRGISKPLNQAKYFTPMVINMVAIGEESGNLDDMLQEIASHYDSEVEYATKGLAEAVGPALTICLAAMVGFFALAIFLPMWDLTKMVQ